MDLGCCILELHVSLSRVEQMEVRMLSMHSFTSSLSDIDLCTSIMTCMGLVFFCKFLFYIFEGRGAVVWATTSGG